MHVVRILFALIFLSGSLLNIETCSVNAADYEVRVNASCIQSAGTITAYWTVSGVAPIPNSDWIGIYKAGRCGTTVGSSCPTGSDAWSFVSKDSSSGKEIISAPSTTDTYIAYYLYNGGYTIKAISSPFTLALSCSTVNMTAEPQIVLSNQTVTISWNGANTSNVDDWISFWQIDSSPLTDHNHLPNEWAYTYGGMNATHAHPTFSGSVTLRAPALFGTYTVYYCQNNGYTCSGSVIVKVVNPNICKPTASTTSKVEHIIVIISENHSFDSIYGRYCQAAPGSKPSCNIGPSCCEAAPEKVSGSSPLELTDEQNLKYDPNHSAECETCEVNNGLMDRFVTGCSCSSASNFAVADNTSAKYYYSWARSYAIADRFFQAAIGASSENDMYLATGKFLFWDNTVLPQDSNMNGARCYTGGFKSYSSTTIADLLNYCHIDWTFYAEGYDVNPTNKQCYPDYYDASDNPFTYFPSLVNSSQVSSRNFRDYQSLFSDITDRTLPAVSYVKGLGIHSEHPGLSSLTAGELISQKIIDAIAASSVYQSNTVVFMVPDESGGYYDHVSILMKSPIDGILYGPRIPFIAVGEQVKRNYISHVEMEFSSIIKFIEWNWLQGEPGQLGTRDTIVNNIADLFDQQKTGVTISS